MRETFRRNPTRTPPNRIQKAFVHVEPPHVLAAQGVSMRTLWSVEYEYVESEPISTQPYQRRRIAV